MTSKSKIFITKNSHPRIREIVHCLNSYPEFQVSPRLSRVKTIIHFAGFASASLSETLNHTSRLCALLKFSSLHKDKFIFVVSSIPSPLRDVSRSLIQQFSQKFPLDYTVIEVSPDTHPSHLVAKITPVLTPPAALPPRSPFLVLTKLLVILVVLPWVVYLIQLLVVYRLFVCGWQSLQSGRWQTSQICSQTAGFLARLASVQTRFVFGAEPVFSAQGYSLTGLFQLSPHLSDSFFWAGVVGEQLTFRLGPLVNTAIPLPSPDVSTIQLGLGKLAQSLAFTQSLFRQARIPASPSIDPFLQESRATVNLLQILLPDLPRFTSQNGSITYLVLVQDDSLLRPSGGQISQVGFVTLKDGRIDTIEFGPVNDVESRLHGQIDPPPELARITTGEKWRFRDINWDPDIPAAAQKVAGLIQKDLSRQVDIVVFTTTSFASQLESITGPVRSGRLALTRPQSVALAKAIFASLANRQSFLVPIPPSSRVSRVGWDGKLQVPPCRVAGCLPDFIYVTDSNIGVTKIDRQIARTYAVKTQISSDLLNTQLRLTYSAPQKYLGFVRLYLPASAQISQVSPLAVIPRISSQPGLTEISFPLDLEPNQPREISLFYSRPVRPRSSFRYQLDIPNQPGNPARIEVVVNYPATWQIKSSLPPQVATGGVVKYNHALSRVFQLGLDIDAQNKP